MVVKAQGTDYGLGLEMKTTKEKSMKAGRAPVPLELEDMPLPLNTFKNKAPFVGTIKSVERIVGPNATGETCYPAGRIIGAVIAPRRGVATHAGTRRDEGRWRCATLGSVRSPEQPLLLRNVSRYGDVCRGRRGPDAGVPTSRKADEWPNLCQ